MSEYRPVACAFYDMFEIAIMRGQRLRTRWRDAQGQVHDQVLLPEDLTIQAGGEYLSARAPAGSPLSLRLDQIESATPVDNGAMPPEGG